MSTALSKRTASTHSLAIFVIVLVSRLPFLTPGYGLDSDSWRVALAAHSIYSGKFAISRFPSYPINEWLSSLMIGFGPVGLNLLSAVFSAIAACAFYALLTRLEIKGAFLGALAFAFVPVVYINSVCTIDYVWALAFLLMSLVCVIDRKLVLAGILLGLGVGCRLTTAAALVPLLFWLYQSKDKSFMVDASKLVVSTLAVALGCYLPGIIVYGTDLFQFYETSYPSITSLGRKATVAIWGRIGLTAVIVLALLLLFRIRAVRRAISKKSDRQGVWLSFLFVLVYLLFYFRLPYESGYLIPVIPFILIIFAIYLRPRWFRAMCVALILSSFISPCRRTGYCHGGIIAKHIERVAQMERIDRIVTAIEGLDHKAVIIAAWDRPILLVSLPDSLVSRHKIEYVIGREELGRDKTQGYDIYFLEEYNRVNYNRTGADPLDLNGRPLPLP